ncbi:MAG: hypothetical protein ACK4V6_06480, partial [Microthrixaceae bacterium]
MTRIEDELRGAAAELRQRTADVDVDGALERVLAEGRRRPRRGPLLAGAAAAVVLALVASAALWWPESGTDLVAGVSSWVGMHLDYVPGSSLPTDGAVRTLLR